MHAISAGTELANDVDFLASKIMGEMGLPLTRPRKLSSDLLEDADYIVSLDEDIRADEFWDINTPKDEDECRKVVKEIDERVRELVRKILI
jgi:protein-tyrosine-phosphatase